MMKQKWVRPQAMVQTFTPNEYVAACGDSGTVYKFECNAGNSNSRYSVYTNGADGVAHTSDDVQLCGSWESTISFGSYHPCGTTHEAKDNGDFVSGYIVPNGGSYGPGGGSSQSIDVIIWTAENTNVHCTTNLNKEDWETVKS